MFSCLSTWITGGVFLCAQSSWACCVFFPHVLFTLASGCCWANKGWSWDGGAHFQLTLFTVSVYLEDCRLGSSHSSSSSSSSSPSPTSSSCWQYSRISVLVFIISVCIFITFMRCHAKEKNDSQSILPKHKEIKTNGSTEGNSRKRTSTLGKFSGRLIRFFPKPDYIDSQKKEMSAILN